MMLRSLKVLRQTKDFRGKPYCGWGPWVVSAMVATYARLLTRTAQEGACRHHGPRALSKSYSGDIRSIVDAYGFSSRLELGSRVFCFF